MPEASFFLLALPLFFLFSFLPLVSSQNSNATCLSSFEWTNNSRGQNPCLVEAYLQAVCQPGWTTPSLKTASSGYPGPNNQTANSCSCSSVTYTLLSACSYCQNGQVNTWSSYISSCSKDEVSNGEFTPGVPAGVAVPAWAFQPVNASRGKWDPTVAQRLAENGLPELIGPQDGSANPSTAIIVTASIGPTITSTDIPTSTADASASLGSRKSDTGAIVGGIIAGIVAIILLVIAALLMRRKIRSKRIARAPSRLVRLSPPKSPGFDQKFPLDLTPPPSANPSYNQMNPHSPGPIYDPFRSSSRVTIYNSTSSDGHTPDPGKPPQALYVPEV